MARGNATTILVIDDHELLRCGVRYAVERHPDEFEIVAETGDGDTGLQLATLHEPTVIILNPNAQRLNGLAIIRTLTQQLPTSAVVVMAGHDDAEALFYAITYGASAYLTRDTSADDLLTVMRRVAQGQRLIDAGMLDPTGRYASGSDYDAEADQAMEVLFPLTVREVETLDMVAKGHTNKQIARAMGISDQTVKNHITSIMRKLAVDDRTQAVVSALRHGWITF